MKIVKRKITPDQSRDTGLAIVLIVLLVIHFGELYSLMWLAIAGLVLTMAWPSLFRPLAPVWFGLSDLLGAVVSRIILSLVFALVVTPVGLIRRLFGADSLQLKRMRKGQESAFTKREHRFIAKDLERPY